MPHEAGSEISAPTRVREDDRKSRFVELVTGGATFDAAAKAIGVTSRTTRYWRDADPDFADLVADARCMADDEVERTVYGKCLDPDPANNGLRMFWLKTRRPEVYADRIKQDITSNGKDVGVTIYLPDNGRESGRPDYSRLDTVELAELAAIARKLDDKGGASEHGR